MFTLRDSSPRRLVFIAGGAGMAPVLSLLRSMAEKGTEREAIFYYGARTEDDLFALDEIERLCGELPNLTFVPALSRRGVGRRDRHGHRRRRPHGRRPRRGRRLPLRPAADGRRRHRPARVRGAHLNRTSTSTGSRRARHDRDAGEEQHARRDRETAAQRSEAGVHRRRGRCQGVPVVAQPFVQLLRAAQAPRDRLRGRHHGRPARPRAPPDPGLGLRVRQRRLRLPAEVDGAQVVRLAQVPRSQRGVGADDLPQQRERRPPDRGHAGEREGRERVRADGTARGRRSSSATCPRGRTSSTASACTSTRPPSAMRRRT